MPEVDERPEPDLGEVERLEEPDLVPAEVVEGEIQPDRRLRNPQTFVGPLPSPRTLGEYDQVLPGLKQRIVSQWEAETAHRHRTIDRLGETDREAMRLYYEGEKRGQWLGFVIFLGILAVAALAIVLDRQAVGIAGFLVAGAYMIWALRRDSSATAPVSTDLGQGDEMETPPEQP